MKTKMWAAILFAGGILIGAGSSEFIHAQARISRASWYFRPI